MPEKDGTCLGISLDLVCVSTCHIDQYSTHYNLVCRNSLSYNDCFTWAKLCNYVTLFQLGPHSRNQSEV